MGKGRYTLLIADDEKWVRQGLRRTIDWEAEGIEWIGEAEDGEEALKQIEEHAPDMIIIDIKMPGIDGLTLIEKLRAENIYSKIIIISGYNDFSFAQRALRCGANDYILKPIEETDLLDVVRKCLDELDQENKNCLQIEQMSGCLRESLPLARQRYLEMLLMGERVYAYGEMKAKWKALQINLNTEHISVLVLKVHDWGERYVLESDRSLIRYALGNIAEEISAEWGSTASCPLNQNNDADLAVLLSIIEPGNLSGKFNSLIDAARDYFGIQASIGFSKERSAEELAYSFEEALHACAFAFYEGYGKVYDAALFPKRQDHPLGYKGPNNSWETRMIYAMKLADEHMLEQLVEELNEHIEASRTKYSPLHLVRGLTSLLQNVIENWEASCSRSETPGVSLSVNKIQLPSCTLFQLKDRLPAVLLQLIRKNQAFGNRRRIIDLALNYIQDHYLEGISMNDVAERHYINPSYFSKVFHEEMGETFSKYILRLRMMKAKELLKESTLKIYEIAQQIGYNDFRHFTKLFKEFEGTTPAQYRDLGI